jgi:hypothetical protein
MTTGRKQIVCLIVFFALLATTVGLSRIFGGRPEGDLGMKQSLERYQFYLQEVSAKCGIDFKHESPVRLDNKLNHIMPIIASMGASVSVVDFDRDGRPDLYVVTSIEEGKNKLYRNKEDGTFEDVAEKLGIADLNKPGDGVCMGAVWGDYDNDGYEDLFVYRWGKVDLYHNDQGKGFTRVTDKVGLAKAIPWVNANSAVWLDYDGDGLLDLFVAGYWRDDIDLWKLEDTKIMPESFQFANNGGSKFLLRNKGDGTFEDVTEKVGITSKRWTLAVAATDLRGTGFPDIILANDYGVNEFYANVSDGQGGRKFVEVGKKTGIGDISKSGMSACFGDIGNQGRFSIYISNITEPGKIIQWNNLWVPRKGTTGDDLVYDNLAQALDVARGGWSWGAQFGDLNNDGRTDLILCNGYISADRSKNDYWYDYSQIAGALTHIISDAAKWPPMKGRSLAGYQSKCVWINKGNKFIDVCNAVGVTDTSDGRAVVLVDLWNRGVLDVVIANQNGPLLVYKNTVAPENDWAQFELEGNKSNKSAIGAQLKLYWSNAESRASKRSELVQLQEVSGGNSYASQNPRRLHFGLGKDAQIDRLEIQWPSGKTQTVGAPAKGTLHKIMEAP